MEYFHEIEQSEVDKLIKDKKTIQYLLDNYKQPDWCGYPKALSGDTGCWSLVDMKKGGLRTKISKEYCSNCDECLTNKTK